jgi:hypothetical protein
MGYPGLSGEDIGQDQEKEGADHVAKKKLAAPEIGCSTRYVTVFDISSPV